jgi:LuxR family transcriptional regulator, maltose regulon positive regulatory protein
VHPPPAAGKFRLPDLGPDAVPRARLLERLDEGLFAEGRFARRLSLVSAPAGCGKTTLLALWARRCLEHGASVRLAWLSLDEGDKEPAVFVSDLRASLRPALPGLWGAVDAAAEPPGGGEAAVTALLNELAEIEERVLIVLDDYHAASCEEVDGLVALFAAYLPPSLHLVIAARADPDLPLPKLRTTGALAELRAEDLRFDEAEAADFLGRRMRLGLSAAEMSALGRRTEGWAAGLRLAAIAIRDRPDASAFVASFAGDHRFVLDYLVEEVLGRVPDELRAFLLRTSVLDRLSVPLCEAVAGGDGRSMLEAALRANLFLTPLDDRREWFRYHGLFADALRSRLAAERPAEIAALHRRASAWYEAALFHEEAIRHAFEGGDIERAAALVEARWEPMDLQARSAAWLEWARRLPAEAIRARPALSAGFGWALLDAGELEESEAWLLAAEEPQPGGDGARDAACSWLPSSIAAARAYRSLASGDIPGTLSQAARAIEAAVPGRLRWSTAAMALMGLARFQEGRLAEAEEMLASCMDAARGTDEHLDFLSVAALLADIRIALGRLHAAERGYEESLSAAGGKGGPRAYVAAELHRGMSEVSLERGDLAGAAERLAIARELGEAATITDWRFRVGLAEARIAEARGEIEEALEILGEAERLHVRTPLPDLRPSDAMKARLWTKRGEVAKALAWARDRGLRADGELVFLDEYAYATLARALIARFGEDGLTTTIEAAVELLSRLIASAEEGGRAGSAIELSAFLALAHDARGDAPSAQAALGRAVLLAEPEGYVRAFLGEGQRMAAMLGRLRAASKTPPQCRAFIDRRLLAESAAAPRPAGAAARLPGASPLRESLSDRELEVLDLLRGDLSGPEIARELYVSLNTLRTHTRNIFCKLDANSRRAAVRKADSLGLGRGAPNS